MMKMKKTVVRAMLTMVGTIIGAGIFGVPLVMEKMGVLVGSFVFWLIAFVILASHLLFLEVIDRVRERMRLPGYVGKVLGSWAKRLAVFTHTFQLAGANFAYLILGGEFILFIAERFGLNLNVLWWQILFWAAGSMAAVLALRLMAKVESALTWGLIFLLVFMITVAVPQADAIRIFSLRDGIHLASVGVFVFAMFGLTAIAEVYEITGRRLENAKRGVFWGTLIAALLTWLFGLFVYAAMATNDGESVLSLVKIFPSFLWWLLPLAGLLAVVTSYITSAFDLQAMFHLDLKQSPSMSKCVALAMPVILLFIAERNFLETIDTVGAFFSAGNGLLVVLAAYAIMRRDKPLLPWGKRALLPVVSAILFLAIIIQRAIALL